MPQPLPVAQTPEIEKIISLYRTRYGVSLTFDQAKRLLENLMRFVYLVEVLPKLAPLIRDQSVGDQAVGNQAVKDGPGAVDPKPTPPTRRLPDPHA